MFFEKIRVATFNFKTENSHWILHKNLLTFLKFSVRIFFSCISVYKIIAFSIFFLLTGHIIYDIFNSWDMRLSFIRLKAAGFLWRNSFIHFKKSSRQRSLKVIRLLKEMGASLYYPYVDSIKGEKYAGLMKLRTRQSNNIFRTFYFVVVKDEETKAEKAVLLHAIQKKTDKTPKKELETALARMKDYKSRE